MKFQIPTREERGLGFRALKTLALSDGEMHQTERDVIQGGQWLFGDDHDLEALPPVTPEELAAGLTDPDKRKQFLAAMVMVTMADGEVNEDETRCLRAFSGALGVDGTEVQTLERIARGQYKRARLDTMRRFWALEKLRALAAEEGVGVYFRAALGLLNIKEEELKNPCKVFSE